LWSLIEENFLKQDEEVIRFCTEVNLGEPITKAKWLNDKSILVATTYGNLFLLKIGLDA
jgi:hypothetical protein